jgi:aminoglycoside phosphotransferase (APT) family kinase protein
LRPVPGTGAGGARLLHLDLHPFNLLVDEDGTVTGVIDWANARAGDPVLDRARTWSILALDPMAVAFAAEPAFQALAEGWGEAGSLNDIPAAARAWACRYMAADLSKRYSPAELAHVGRARAQAEADSAGAQPGAHDSDDAQRDNRQRDDAQRDNAQRDNRQ